MTDRESSAAKRRYLHAAGLVLPERGDGLHWLRCDACGREWAEKDSGAFAKGSRYCSMARWRDPAHQRETRNMASDANRKAASGRYRTIVADPPWPVKQPPKKFGASGNGPLPYPSMALEDIAILPVAEMATDQSHLYLWTVNRFVEDAYTIMRLWGWRPSMLLTWCKQPMGQGPGYEFASTTEFVLFGRRGKADYPPPARIDRNWWLWKRGEHSAKPEAFLDIVEQVSPGPYLELFARRQRLGWDTWGDEALNHVELSA